MMVSPHDYDRDERRGSSWWSSRHSVARDSTDILKRTRRITLFDLVLLLVMAGVLVPFILTKAAALGPYKVVLSVKNHEDERRLALKIYLPGKRENLSESPVGWKIFDTQGTLIHEEWDLPPGPGTTREFFFISDAHVTLKCEITAGGELYTRLFEKEP